MRCTPARSRGSAACGGFGARLYFFCPDVVVMVTIKKSLVLSCAGLALGLSSLAWAGNAQFRIQGQSIPLTISSPLSYMPMPADGSGDPTYVLEVSLDGFLFCNSFAESGNVMNTDIRVRPYHGSWLFGVADKVDVTDPYDDPTIPRSFTRIAGWTYAAKDLVVSACDASSGTSDCAQSPNKSATLQCYTANAHGRNVRDARSIFASSFEPERAGGHNSWVEVNPATSENRNRAAGDSYWYRIDYAIPAAGQQALSGLGDGSQPQGPPSTLTRPNDLGVHYVLQVGYDSDVFASCDVFYDVNRAIAGEVVTSTGHKLIECTPDPAAFDPNTHNNPNNLPVFAAVLFVGPEAPAEATSRDNVGFYPHQP